MIVRGKPYTRWALLLAIPTKGYWHNKNGLQELTDAHADIAGIDLLDPYEAPSAYFDGGDEPFDGKYADGTDVAGAFEGDPAIWGPGTWQSEVSRFLVDDNAAASANFQKEQLAQQLLAFIFNVDLRVGSRSVPLAMPGGGAMTGGQIIAAAIQAWNTGVGVNEWQGILEGFNSNANGPVTRILPTPCAYAFPQ